MSNACLLQDLKPDVFLHTMRSAALYNMPKLLACCEHHVVTVSVGRDMTLERQCRTEQLLFHSYSRIAMALVMSLGSSVDQASTKQQDCECRCCRHVSCQCKALAPPSKDLSSYIPSPQELLKMAMESMPHS